MKKTFFLALACVLSVIPALAVDLGKCRIAVSAEDAPLVQKMAQVLSQDIERVTGIRPPLAAIGRGPQIVLATVGKASQVCGKESSQFDVLNGKWEQFKIVTDSDKVMIVGSDPRGLAYGVFHLSEAIGVNPWYWWADVPVEHRATINYKENFTSDSPTIKYRGVFINDEDWGMKTWSSENFEKELGDIGPKTYDKVCELILRLKGNMLAPAMHTCTGAFYSHPDSQKAADEWGIMITTSHCEPMLFNNAAPSEWDRERDGEWNYKTNKETILKKFDDRLRETAQYDNIYTTGMRGLHDAAMQGSKDPAENARVLEQVFADQRSILENYKRKAAIEIPQIFVPYKETLDIYDAGLRVPEDITLVWPDDNYGYMKRVSNETERKRSGGSGVYYHVSYLGAPHDHLWICTTAPALMYEELRKAYDSGADRYWLLNVGDIKPMELAVSQFFNMAWDLESFSYDNVNRYQPAWLSSVFGQRYQEDFQQILDSYYRLAWDRKPEFMGYEFEWDSPENVKLHDTDFSYENGSWQKRMDEYKTLSDKVMALENSLPESLRPSFFEILGYSVRSAYQINRKFLMAQRNHETGEQSYKTESLAAHDSIGVLLNQYNKLLDGKWDQMMSQLPPGYVAKYQNVPEYVSEPTDAYKLPQWQWHPVYENQIDFTNLKPKSPFRIFEGMGTDWSVLQMGNPMDPQQNPSDLGSDSISIQFETDDASRDKLSICVSVVPVWPVSYEVSNRFGVSLDGGKPQVCENKFAEYGDSWKLQVVENRKDFYLDFPVEPGKKSHTLTFVIGDPGQIIQKITYR